MTKKTFALALLVSGVLTLSTLPLAQAEGPGQGAPAVQGPHNMKERHPAMRRALHALWVAKRALAHGAHDFHGHRARALRLTNMAIAQVKQGLRVDKK